MTSYALVFIAEIGDKSQLMCMLLAARYRALPVALGAISSFVLLNSVAVTLGAVFKELLEPQWISVIVAILFLIFGLQAIFTTEEEDETKLSKGISAKRLFITTFMLITVAELGDKTQLAVVALGSVDIPLSIFIGATLALATTTILGVWAGHRLLKNVPMRLVHKVSGVFFICLGLVAAMNAFNTSSMN